MTRKTFIWLAVLAACAAVYATIFKPGPMDYDARPWLFFFCWGVVFAGIYFLPGMLATERGHRNCAGIIVLNVFLGWTGVGWVGALIWAIWKEKNSLNPPA